VLEFHGPSEPTGAAADCTAEALPGYSCASQMFREIVILPTCVSRISTGTIALELRRRRVTAHALSWAHERSRRSVDHRVHHREGTNCHDFCGHSATSDGTQLSNPFRLFGLDIQREESVCAAHDPELDRLAPVIPRQRLWASAGFGW
jgi:hypothetical protein